MSLQNEDNTCDPYPDTGYLLYEIVENRELITKLGYIDLGIPQVAAGAGKLLYLLILLTESLYDSCSRKIIIGKT